MIKKVERPDWIHMAHNCGYGVALPERGSKYFDRWFDEHIEPINKALDAAVMVYGQNDEVGGKSWRLVGLGTEQYKGLLINVEPINQETCADVLKQMTEIYSSYFDDAILERAKEALERES